MITYYQKSDYLPNTGFGRGWSINIPGSMRSCLSRASVTTKRLLQTQMSSSGFTLSNHIHLKRVALSAGIYLSEECRMRQTSRMEWHGDKAVWFCGACNWKSDPRECDMGWYRRNGVHGVYLRVSATCPVCEVRESVAVQAHGYEIEHWLEMMYRENEQMDKPELILVKSVVYTCTSCKKWVERMPAFASDLGKGYHCECGCTSVYVREGRPFGRKSRHWEWIKRIFDDCWEYVYPPDSVVTQPPLQDIPRWQRHHQGLY